MRSIPGLDFEVIGQVCDVIKECLDMGVQVGLVVGGGNFWRGAKNSGGAMERTRADHMGMLATVMNCLAVADVCEQKGIPVRVQTAIEMRAVAEPYIRSRAIRHLEKGRVVIFGCRHRQSLLLHGHCGGAAGGGDRRRRDFAGQERGRRLHGRPGKGPHCGEVRRHHL